MPAEFGPSGHADYNYSLYCNYIPGMSYILSEEPKSVQLDTMQAVEITIPARDTLKTAEPAASAIEKIDIAEMKVNEIKVYPNPFSYKLNFEFEPVNDTRAILEIYNVNGQLIKRLMDKQVAGGVRNHVEYTPVDINPGIYIYKLNLDGKTSVGKVIYRK